MNQKNHHRPMTTEFLRRYADHFTVTRHVIALVKEYVARGEEIHMDLLLQRALEDLAKLNPNPTAHE